MYVYVCMFVCMYVGSGIYGVDPELEQLQAPLRGDGAMYILGTGFSMLRAKLRIKEIEMKHRRRIRRKAKRSKNNKRNKRNKKKKKKSLSISLPLKVVGDDCDEVIFDMDKFVLTLRSIR